MKKFTRITCVLLLAAVLTSCGSTVQPNFKNNNASYESDDNRITNPNAAPDASDGDVETAKPVDLPSKGDESRISFLAAGDNIIHGNVFMDAENRAKSGEKYNFIDMYDGIADAVAEADLAFINQETPICGDELGIYGFPNFNSPEAVGDTLIDLGFDIVNIANNHTIDMKEKGYKGTLDYWSERKNDITMIGGYYNKEDYENIRIIESKGISIAFISYTYGTNLMYLPTSSELMIPSMDINDKDHITQDEIVRMTKKADELADLVFVVMHWGTENSFAVSSTQKQLASAITEAGADVIIGMHPHVIQNMEWKTASDGSKTLVIYSLGNLINTQYDNQNLVGGIVTFDIVKDKDGNITIQNPIYNPTVTHYDKDRLGLQVYFLEDYTEDLAKLHGNPKHGNAAPGKDKWTMDVIKRFAIDNVSEEFLPDFLK